MTKNEIIAFFKSHTAYKKFCTDCAKKYKSYGSLTGIISLEKYTDDEIAELSSFLGIADYQLQKRKQLSIKRWLSQYAKSSFASIPFEEIISEVTGAPLYSNEAICSFEQQKEKTFVGFIAAQYHALNTFIKDSPLPRELYLAYHKHELKEQELECLNSALEFLPYKKKQYAYLPVFSNQITGNPHSFDRGSLLGKWFVRLLFFDYERAKTAAPVALSKAEKEHRVLQHYGILFDDIFNFVTVNGMYGFANEKLHPVWKAACETCTVWNVPLKHIVEMDRIEPAFGNRFWIVENSSLYSLLISAFPTLPAVCSHGQFKQSFWQLMEKIPASITAFYTGDFDPEGLIMADTVKRRYPTIIDLHFMSAAYYALSKPAEKIESQRLKKLDRMQTPMLQEAAAQMRKQESAGYQEALFDEYCNYLYHEKLVKGC
ncbi:putative TIGR02679 family protein [Treponema phagedenis F0421]|uniref:TIGR02679 domain-containing protein n=1 Tax=Treponema phagedenis TaxID=162 RepID=UPI0001F63F59|nr:TIGR02679 domain-containing protein [Treponema phagedenis]EFW37347.1 putative TIGR02679 family protein [Treponema phagedenis F0421]